MSVCVSYVQRIVSYVCVIGMGSDTCERVCVVGRSCHMPMRVVLKPSTCARSTSDPSSFGVVLGCRRDKGVDFFLIRVSGSTHLRVSWRMNSLTCSCHL